VHEEGARSQRASGDGAARIPRTPRHGAHRPAQAPGGIERVTRSRSRVTLHQHHDIDERDDEPIPSSERVASDRMSARLGALFREDPASGGQEPLEERPVSAGPGPGRVAGDDGPRRGAAAQSAFVRSGVDPQRAARHDVDARSGQSSGEAAREGLGFDRRVAASHDGDPRTGPWERAPELHDRGRVEIFESDRVIGSAGLQSSDRHGSQHGTESKPSHRRSRAERERFVAAQKGPSRSEGRFETITEPPAFVVKKQLPLPSFVQLLLSRVGDELFEIGRVGSRGGAGGTPPRGRRGRLPAAVRSGGPAGGGPRPVARLDPETAVRRASVVRAMTGVAGFARRGPVKVRIIGAGLAGSEIALQLGDRGFDVELFEMKRSRRTPAQVSDDFAELVCSNSFRGAALQNAVGAIKEEMRRIGGRLIRIGDACSVPAGGALAVDRERFSREVTDRLRAHPRIRIEEHEVSALFAPEPGAKTVVATGPLTSDEFARSIRDLCDGADRLYFYDAIAPIVSADGVDTGTAFAASRWDKGCGDDYLNCPLDREAYERFVDALLEADVVTPRPFEEDRFFEGCLPIEVMASRGRETLRYGCMKPVGLTDPRTGRWPHAVVQLRAENRERTAYNLVGFQTRLKWGPQKALLRSIPGLENAEILRYGAIHRNTYIDAPRLLDVGFRLKGRPDVLFAGQITGVEGYVESMACGLLVALMLEAERDGLPFEPPPETTTLGALYRHVLGVDRTGPADRDHVPSNVHWGMVAPLPERVPKREKKTRLGERAVADLTAWWVNRRVGAGRSAPPTSGSVRPEPSVSVPGEAEVAPALRPES